MNKAINYTLKTFLAILVFGIFIQTVPFVRAVNGSIGDIFLYERKAAVIGETAFIVEVSDTDKKRAKGLSGRKELEPDKGMLFIFSEEDRQGIWMKDMEINIDIVWINSHFEVVHIEKDVSPDSFPKVFRPFQLAKFVIEMNAGFVQKNNIKKGDLFTIL